MATGPQDAYVRTGRGTARLAGFRGGQNHSLLRQRDRRKSRLRSKLGNENVAAQAGIIQTSLPVLFVHRGRRYASDDCEIHSSHGTEPGKLSDSIGDFSQGSQKRCAPLVVFTIPAGRESRVARDDGQC